MSFRGWNATGRVGRTLYAILDHKDISHGIYHTREDAAWTMRMNNGRGRSWRIVRFAREAANLPAPKGRKARRIG